MEHKEVPQKTIWFPHCFLGLRCVKATQFPPTTQNQFLWPRDEHPLLFIVLVGSSGMKGLNRPGGHLTFRFREIMVVYPGGTVPPLGTKGSKPADPTC